MIGKIAFKQKSGSWDQASLCVAGVVASAALPHAASLHPPLILPHTPPRHFTHRYDAIFTIRVLLAVLLGIGCGLTGLTGLQTFIAYMAANFIVPSSWFGYQGVDPVSFEDEKQPLSMEGFGQGMSLFVLSWTVSYSLAHGLVA